MDRKPLRVDDDLIEEINPLKSPQQRRYELAKQEELDLIEISPNANPPVCKIMDMGKHKYDLQKKANQAKKKQKRVDLS